MKITLSSIPVSDQDKALKFYTEVLGFIKKKDLPAGDARWLTVVSPDDPDGVELLLEPNAGYPAMKALKEAFMKDGIPFTAFQVKDVNKEHERLRDLGVKFMNEPITMKENPGGPVTLAIFDDTCGNLIMIYRNEIEN
jgi:catechol 2,3-dioxygenase-like lactoylglutathione lyase family enzyme